MHLRVGCSGFTARPKRYIVLGISGAPGHIESMKDSGVLAVISTHPRAPVFGFSHNGIVVDMLEVLPVLAGVIESGKGSSHPA